ncbi:hydroxymethylglutaryl-CoA lyase [Zhongshania sp. BJYM1]|uniref:hydroxymethylglutaryl-CoA lyase n=1 Tax=Zhongshania aquatica TaxID=2965069 RepID=UPI0022B496E0|nr:hydroxymethylglutaryl-CoA lyase [Marortus sp. BJYM1]
MKQTSLFPKRARIVEVGPRDGLQNEKKFVDIETRVELINQLTKSGITHIEAGSFVNPTWVPQMAGSDDVFSKITRGEGTSYIALTPNMRGFERAMEVGVKEVAIFASASEAFSQKNINCSIAESITRFEPIFDAALKNDVAVRGYVSTIAGCPYQEEVSVDVVVALAEKLLAMGCYEISLGDTTGVGTPAQIHSILTGLLQRIPASKLAVHFHDTNGQALENIKVALELGISVIDSSIGGLGGCPYAKGASGNVATEEVIELLDKLDIAHGINLEELTKARQFIREKLSQ